MPRSSLLAFLGWVFACNVAVAMPRSQAAGGKHFWWDFLLLNGLAAGQFLLPSLRSTVFAAPGRLGGRAISGLLFGLLISNFAATIGRALARNNCFPESDIAVYTVVGSGVLAGIQALPLILRDLYLTVRPTSA